jgi:hypothetical protein
MDHIVLSVMSGEQDGMVYSFSATPITLGRHPNDDVWLPYDERVSRHHARITRENRTYYLEDVGPEGKGSANGTYLIDVDKDMNENKITGKTPISSGTHFRLGPVWLKFECISELEHSVQTIPTQIENASRKVSAEKRLFLISKITEILNKLRKDVTGKGLVDIVNEIRANLSDAQELPLPDPIEDVPEDIDSINSIRIQLETNLEKKMHELEHEGDDLD